MFDDVFYHVLTITGDLSKATLAETMCDSSDDVFDAVLLATGDANAAIMADLLCDADEDF